MNTIKGPLLVMGDMNCDPEQMERHGWLRAMEASILKATGFTCFVKDKEPTIRDWAMVNEEAKRYIQAVDLTEMNFKPHLGLLIEIKGEHKDNLEIQLNLPNPFNHPKRRPKQPNPESKRQKAKIEWTAKKEAEAGQQPRATRKIRKQTRNTKRHQCRKQDGTCSGHGDGNARASQTLITQKQAMKRWTST